VPYVDIRAWGNDAHSPDCKWHSTNLPNYGW
jgi:hypothetical protein